MNNLPRLAPKLRGNPRFYAPPLFALLTSRLQKPELQKRTTVLFIIVAALDGLVALTHGEAGYC